MARRDLKDDDERRQGSIAWSSISIEDSLERTTDLETLSSAGRYARVPLAARQGGWASGWVGGGGEYRMGAGASTGRVVGGKTYHHIRICLHGKSRLLLMKGKPYPIAGQLQLELDDCDKSMSLRLGPSESSEKVLSDKILILHL